MALTVKNFTKKKIPLKLFDDAFKMSLEILDLGPKRDINLIICGDRRIRNLNRTYRHKDKITDVLSFGAVSGTGKEKKFIVPEGQEAYLGEIFISQPEAERQARAYRESLNKVLARLLVHAILHLTGYDHEKNKKEAERMFELQEKILNTIGF